MPAATTDPGARTAVRVSQRTFRAAAGWGCVCGIYAGALRAVCWPDLAFPSGTPKTIVGPALLLALIGSVLGCGAGTAVGVFSLFYHRNRRNLFVLMLGGTLFGAFGCGLGTLAAVAVHGPFDPLLNSSLAMAAVGFLAGLCGYAFSHKPTTPDAPPYEEEEESAPAVKVEWLLREPKRSWRIYRPLARVLPVFAVSCSALVGAALLASSQVALALLAIGLLGLAVALVLYQQEHRLDALERRNRGA